MANQITVNSGTGNITVTTSRAVIGTVANVASANYANFAGEAFDVSGSNVTGAVANATFATTAATANNATTANTATSATTAGTVTTNAQPNITSVGNLTSLTVTNTTTTGNLVVLGNLQVGNLVANSANYANFAGTAFAVAGANVSGTVANATYAANAGNANTANSATVANSANSVTLANVSGAGNIAGINLDGNVSNLLTGNGTFVAIPTGGGNTDNISNGTSNVSIPTANANIEVYANTQHWTFADDGNLILADGNGVIQSIANSSLDPILPNVSTMKLTPDQNYSSQALVLDPTTPGHIHLRAPGATIDEPIANIYLGGEASSFEVGVFNGAAPNLFVHSGNNTWGFDNTGNLTLPGNTFAINYADGNAVPLDGPVANANYANFAGQAIDATQSNITQTGNLVALTVNSNTANSTTVQVNGNLISYAGANYYSVTNAYNAGAGIGARGSQAIVLVNANDSDFSRNDYYLNKGGNAKMAFSEVLIDNSTIGNGGTDPLVPGSVGWSAYHSGSNLANASTTTAFNFNIGGGALNIQTGAPVNNPAVSLILYGNSAGGSGQQGIRFRRRGGNADSRTNVAANYYLGNIEWQGASTATGGFNANATIARVSAKVESTYANTGPIPTALEFQVSNGTTSTHNFHANGNVTFSNVVNATTFVGNIASSNVTGLGNIATINLDGNASNVLFGNGTFGPEGSTGNANYANFAGNAFSVDGGNVVGAVANATFALDAGNANIANIAYSVDGANVSGTVANATFALDAGNANIANIAYSVDAANVSGLGNIATINLDGNASNLLDGTGNFVAIPTTTANANYANFAGDVVNSAQPNITSVGTLTALTANTTTPINVSTTNGNVSFTTFNNANTAGRRLEFVYNNPVTFNTSVFGAQEDGFALFIANNSSGNSFPGNIKGYWQFLTNGNLQHTIGGTGNINVKGATVTGNVNASGRITAPNITANTGIFTGNASGLTNIPGANVTGFVPNANIANTAYSVAAANVSGLGNIAVINLDGNASNFLDGTGNFVTTPAAANANYANFAGTVLTNAQPNITSVGTLSSLTVSNNSSSQAIVVNQEGNGGITSYNMYNDTSVFTVQSFFRSRGNASSQTAVGTNDTIFTQNYGAYGDSGNTYVNVGYQENKVGTNYGNGQVSLTSTFAASYAGSSFNVSGYDNINLNGNVATPNDINVNSSNVVIGANGRLAYLRTFGSFTSNATQTSNGANTTNYMTLNNTEDANGISIVSNSQLTVARTGRYNIQFSVSALHDTNQTANLEIWLTKNGTAVANTNGRLVLQKDQPMIAAWNYVDNVTTANTYYQLAWASPDTTMELAAFDTANTIAGVAIPSVIATITPVGA